VEPDIGSAGFEAVALGLAVNFVDVIEVGRLPCPTGGPHLGINIGKAGRFDRTTAHEVHLVLADRHGPSEVDDDRQAFIWMTDDTTDATCAEGGEHRLRDVSSSDSTSGSGGHR
jgi:hypothetical protein